MATLAVCPGRATRPDITFAVLRSQAPVSLHVLCIRPRQSFDFDFVLALASACLSLST